MFEVHDVIRYGSQGVCEIVDVEEKSIGGVKKKYYVLKPVKDPTSVIYAPTDNANVLKKMRRLLTVGQINGLIDSMQEKNVTWIANDSERREHYKNILARGDHSELIQMIKAIYSHKKQREADGKRLHMVDERFFNDAEQILYNEFQYVLKLDSKDALMAYILSRLH